MAGARSLIHVRISIQNGSAIEPQQLAALAAQLRTELLAAGAAEVHIVAADQVHAGARMVDAVAGIGLIVSPAGTASVHEISEYLRQWRRQDQDANRIVVEVASAVHSGLPADPPPRQPTAGPVAPQPVSISGASSGGIAWLVTAVVMGLFWAALTPATPRLYDMHGNNTVLITVVAYLAGIAAMAAAYFTGWRLGRLAPWGAEKRRVYRAGMTLFFLFAASCGCLIVIAWIVYASVPRVRAWLDASARELNGWGMIWLMALTILLAAANIVFRPTSAIPLIIAMFSLARFAIRKASS
jgi:hypothetical protein